MDFLKSFAIILLSRYIEKYLMPQLEELAKASPNKFDDVLVDPTTVDHTKRLIQLALELLLGKKKLSDLKAE